MFQAIACRDDKKGYYISKSNLPQELSDDTIVFMPELSTKHKDHVKYVSKYTHTSGNIIVKLVRSDGLDPFGRPKALSHSLIIPSEEYTFNSLYYYSSPLFHTDIFDKIESEPVMLNEKIFRSDPNEILEKVDLTTLREIIVAAMITTKVVLQPSLDEKGLIELASVIDKAIPYEASYDFSLITYSDRSCEKQLVHNILYSFSKEQNKGDSVAIKNKKGKITSIARGEKEYLNDFIEMILKDDHEALLEENAKWVIGMHINSHKELQKLFTKRYELDIPFSRRNKFQAKLSKYMKRLLHE